MNGSWRCLNAIKGEKKKRKTNDKFGDCAFFYLEHIRQYLARNILNRYSRISNIQINILGEKKGP